MRVSHKLRVREQTDSGNWSSSDILANLTEGCEDYDYVFFHLVTQNWTVNLLLYNMTSLLFRLLSQTRTISTSTSELPPIPNPWPYGASIASYCHHFFRPKAGLFGAQHASWPMGAALQYYSATRQINSMSWTQYELCSVKSSRRG